MLHEFRPEKYYNTLGAREPALIVDDGDVISTTTLDASGRDENEREIATGGNPMTGPFCTRGAEQGDALAVDLEYISPNRTRGYTNNIIAANILDPGAPRPESDRQKLFWRIDNESGAASLELTEGYPEGMTVPLKPMLGCFGVAPALGQAISTATSGPHGGNMDYRGFTAGSTAMFPVSEDGALFYLGDGHAWQADGEILGTGIEVSMDVRFRLRIIKNKRVGWPRGEDADGIFTLGNARPLDQAAQHATTEMLRWLCDDYGLSPRAAHLLLGSFIRYELGNMFDPAYTMVCRLSREGLEWVSA